MPVTPFSPIVLLDRVCIRIKYFIGITQAGQEGWPVSIKQPLELASNRWLKLYGRLVFTLYKEQTFNEIFQQ